ncbi:GTPase Era [bacterium]|nr:GTPase Era [bacterium]
MMTENGLNNHETYKAGFVGFLGWTNVGKSTLINHLTGMRIAITADSPQTTRHRLIGILQDDKYQIALTDTPGIHNPRNELSNRMLKTTWGAMNDMDLILWMVFPDRSVDVQFQTFKNRLENYRAPLIIAVNKMDTVPKGSIIPLVAEFQEKLDPVAIVPISALTGENVARLIDVIVEALPAGEPMFPTDQVTDQPERLIVSEYIREKIIEHTYQEMPHVVAVEIEVFKTLQSGLLDIAATIHVEKKSQKGIVIGARGEMIKAIGIDARKLIASFFETKVNLQLWVKVSPRWRSDPTRLRQIGYSD